MKTTLNFLIMAMMMAIVMGCSKPSGPIDLGAKPTVTTGNVASITETGATLNGNVTLDGGKTVTSRGIWISINSNPTSANTVLNGGQGLGLFTVLASNLSPNTTYYYKAYATNSKGTSTGNEVVFTTLAPVPATLALTLSSLSLSGAELQGNIIPNGSIISETGLCYATSHDPTTASNKIPSNVNTGTFTKTLSGLSENTKYYVRAYAVTNSGTLYSPEIEAWTYGLTDIDGNGYHAVTIGTQTWTVENFKSTHYLNGDEIPNVTDNTEWSNLTTGARCYYNNDRASYEPVYGCLYNWYVTNDSRGLAPSGWHVSDDDEWVNLMRYLGNNSNTTVGGKLKESGTAHWKDPNTGATNSSGFTALGGGARGIASSGGVFGDLTLNAYFWSSTDYGPYAYGAYLQNDLNALYHSYVLERGYGFNIRLVKD